PHIRIGGDLTAVRGLWSLLAGLPLFDSVVATRIGLVLIPLVAILLALSVDRVAFSTAGGWPAWLASARFWPAWLSRARYWPAWLSRAWFWPAWLSSARFSRGARGAVGPVRARALWILVVLLAILPILPAPLATSPPHVPPTPTFFSSGTWHSY